MADPDLSNSEFAAYIGSLGITRPRLVHIHGAEATFADAVHPKDVRASFERWLELYESGVIREQRQTPQPGLLQFGQLPVYLVDRDDPSGPGFIEMTFDFGVPEGGWASPALFEAIRERASSDDRFSTVRSNFRPRRPLSGRAPYEHGDRTFRVDSGTGNGYRLQEVTFRPYSVGERKVGNRQRVAASTTLATVDAAVLHDHVARGIVEVLSGAGAPMTLSEAGYLPVLSANDRKRQLLAHRRERLQGHLERARELAVGAGSESMSRRLLDDAKRIEGDLVLTEDEIARLDVEGPAVVSEVSVPAAEVVEALGALARARAAVPHDIAAAIARLVPTFRLFLADSPDRLRWTAVVQLPAADGMIVELGPISGFVPTRGHHEQKGRRHSREIQGAIVAAYAKGDSPQEIIQSTGCNVDQLRDAVRDHLRAGGFPHPASLMLRHVLVPELRRLVADAARVGIPHQLTDGSVNPADLAEVARSAGVVPARCDPRWAALVLEQLVFHPRVGTAYAWLGNCESQAAIDAVMAGKTTIGDICRAMGLPHDGRSALRKVLGTNTEPPLLAPVGTWVYAGTHPISANRLELIACPHCGGHASVHLRVPEISTNLLCPDCRRMTLPDSPVFPPGYLNVPRGLSKAPAMPRSAAPKRQALSQECEEAIIAAYRDPERQVLEILEEFGIGGRVLYRILAERRVERRLPHRPRTRAVKSGTQTSADPT
jgi:transposase-like protein